MRTLPFKGLYYFYVTAQQQSIKLAAEKLYVSPAAVSQQIRTVEETLDVTLFDRQHRSLLLTTEGERLLPYVKSSFETLNQGVDDLLDDDEPNIITLSVLPSFASRWLIPKLTRFYSLHPEITVNLTMTEELESFSSRSVDAVIRFGKGEYDGLSSQFIMKDYLYPVCHSSYCSAKKINSISDLQKLRLLDDTANYLSWERTFSTNRADTGNMSYWDYWLDYHECDIKLFANRQKYDGSHYVMDSVLSAQGVAMVRHSLAAELVQEGNLTKLFPESLELEYQYYFCAPAHYFRRPKLKKFFKWLKAESNQFMSANLP